MTSTLNRSNTVVALGSIDTEMFSIQHMLRKSGYRTAFAQRFGKRCVSSNAYLADSLSRYSEDQQQIVWVECRSPAYQAGRDLIVDHHARVILDTQPLLANIGKGHLLVK